MQLALKKVIQTVIQNTKRLASYVYLRNGIYYFQLRIRKNDARQSRYKSGLIRKSLGTGNYMEAVCMARKLWVGYMSEEYDDPRRMDEKFEREGLLYDRGRELNLMYDNLDHYSDEEQEAFNLAIGGGKYSAEFDAEALQFYSDIQAKRGDGCVASQQDIIVTNGMNSVPIKDLVDKFILDNQDSAKPWGKDQLEKYTKELEFFCKQMNYCVVSDLTVSGIKSDYVNKLHKLPAHAHRQKVLKDKSGNLFDTDTLIKLTKENGLSLLSARTYKAKAEKVVAFLRYIIEDLDDVELDSSILKAFNQLKKVKKLKKKRMAFTDDELRLIFNRDEFYKGEWFRKYRWRHWGPLIALYTGARLNEICQLDTEDVIQDKQTGIFYFDIHKKTSVNRVKTEVGHRQVPIHQVLIDLGFLNYVDFQRKSGEKKLFSELTFSERSGWGRKLKDWFNDTYLKRVGVKKVASDKHTTKCFHCFRNTVINYEKQHGLNREVMEEVVGHEAQFKKTSHDDYADLYNLKNRQRELNKVKYDIDVDKIMKWK